MRTRSFAMRFYLLGVAGLFACGVAAQTGQAPPLPAGVEVLTRGPVHEAFAQVVDINPVASPIVPKQPPSPIEEQPPDQRPEGENVQWIPGYWAWDQDQSDYIWVSGIWRVPPADRQWVPGHWQQVQGGWQWVSGLWLPLGQTDLNIVPTPPAAPEQETAPPAADATSTYVPGIWVFEQNRFVWRPGFWVTYHPGWVWIPAHYVWAPSAAFSWTATGTTLWKAAA
jgi:WXXGXW repeat (2 copies)